MLFLNIEMKEYEDRHLNKKCITQAISSLKSVDLEFIANCDCTETFAYIYNGITEVLQMWGIDLAKAADQV